MGTLVPEEFPLASLANEAERRVVEACRDGLTDGWLILPHIGIRTRQRDHELTWSWCTRRSGWSTWR